MSVNSSFVRVDCVFVCVMATATATPTMMMMRSVIFMFILYFYLFYLHIPSLSQKMLSYDKERFFLAPDFILTLFHSFLFTFNRCVRANTLY